MALFIIPATHSVLTGRWWQIDRTQELQRLIEYRDVPERRNCDRTRPMACDRTLTASDQLITALTVGTIGRVRLVAEKRDFISNGYFLSGAYKYTPNRANEMCGAEKTYLGC